MVSVDEQLARSWIAGSVLIAVLAGCAVTSQSETPVDQTGVPTQEASSVVPVTAAALADRLEADERPIVKESTTTTTTRSPETVDDAEFLTGMRDEMVDLLIQRGADPEDAEVEADRLMTEGVDRETATAVMEKQLEIWENWMANYQLHPVMGSLWTEKEAECAIMEMLKQNGVAGTERLMTIANVETLDPKDATALVQPIADCMDLRALTLEAMTIGGADSPECLLAPVTEEQIVLWHVIQFMAGQEAYWAAVSYDLDLTCIGGPA